MSFLFFVAWTKGISCAASDVASQLERGSAQEAESTACTVDAAHADTSVGALSPINLLRSVVSLTRHASASLCWRVLMRCMCFTCAPFTSCVVCAQIYAERDIMTFVDNPFVVSLYCSFETQVRFTLCSYY